MKPNPRRRTSHSASQPNSKCNSQARSKRCLKSTPAQKQARSRFRRTSPSLSKDYIVGTTERLAGHFRRLEVEEVVDSSTFQTHDVERASLPKRRRGHSITAIHTLPSTAALRPVLGLVGYQHFRSRSYDPPRSIRSSTSLPTISETILPSSATLTSTSQSQMTSSTTDITVLIDTLPSKSHSLMHPDHSSQSKPKQSLDWTAYQLAISGPTGDYLQQGIASPTISDLSMEDSIAQWFHSYNFSGKEGLWTTQWNLATDNIAEPVELDARNVAEAIRSPDSAEAGEWDWEWEDDSSSSSSSESSNGHEEREGLKNF